MPDVAAIADQVLRAIAARHEVYLVGIGGLPGSGKSVLAQQLSTLRPDCAIISMDGYHLPRAQLDPDRLQRRGAVDTFDGESFWRDLNNLHETHSGSFPTFDHADQDPRSEGVCITPDVPLVIVEGIYVLLKSWACEQFFDFRVFLDIDAGEAIERLAARHLAAGIVQSLAKGRQRAIEYDSQNAKAILADRCRERADLVIDTSREQVEP